MDKFTDEKYNVGVNHEHVFLALMRLSSIKLNNLNMKNKVSSIDFQLPNSNIYIESKYRQLSSNGYNTALFDKTGWYLAFLRKAVRSLYIYVLASLMVNITLSNIIKNCLIVLILSIC